jgi:hypothetical protein
MELSADLASPSPAIADDRFGDQESAEAVIWRYSPEARAAVDETVEAIRWAGLGKQ